MSTKNKALSDYDRLVQENARLRGDLLTIASRFSHDLRTPLGSILNTGELMREILAEKDASTVRLADPLFNSVDELQALIKSISFVARASASRTPMVGVKMAEIVGGTLQELESRILKKNTRVQSPDDWPEVEGAPNWLAFIWWHLIVHTLNHGGQKIQLGWRAEKDGFRFWISDGGPGVPTPERAKLFQPFDSLHEPESTGCLELSIVQRLVELQGGHCGCETDASGNRLYFTLPHLKEVK